MNYKDRFQAAARARFEMSSTEGDEDYIVEKMQASFLALKHLNRATAPSFAIPVFDAKDVEAVADSVKELIRECEKPDSSRDFDPSTRGLMDEPFDMAIKALKDKEVRDVLVAECHDHIELRTQPEDVERKIEEFIFFENRSGSGARTDLSHALSDEEFLEALEKVTKRMETLDSSSEESIIKTLAKRCKVSEGFSRKTLRILKTNLRKQLKLDLEQDFIQKRRLVLNLVRDAGPSFVTLLKVLLVIIPLLI